MDLAHPHGKFTGALSRSLKSMSNLTALTYRGLGWTQLARIGTPTAKTEVYLSDTPEPATLCESLVCRTGRQSQQTK